KHLLFARISDFLRPAGKAPDEKRRVGILMRRLQTAMMKGVQTAKWKFPIDLVVSESRHCQSESNRIRGCRNVAQAVIGGRGARVPPTRRNWNWPDDGRSCPEHRPRLLPAAHPLPGPARQRGCRAYVLDYRPASLQPARVVGLQRKAISAAAGVAMAEHRSDDVGI